jgi:hypothetical protein
MSDEFLMHCCSATIGAFLMAAFLCIKLGGAEEKAKAERDKALAELEIVKRDRATFQAAAERSVAIENERDRLRELIAESCQRFNDVVYQRNVMRAFVERARDDFNRVLAEAPTTPPSEEGR